MLFANSDPYGYSEILSRVCVVVWQSSELNNETRWTVRQVYTAFKT